MNRSGGRGTRRGTVGRGGTPSVARHHRARPPATHASPAAGPPGRNPSGNNHGRRCSRKVSGPASCLAAAAAAAARFPFVAVARKLRSDHDGHQPCRWPTGTCLQWLIEGAAEGEVGQGGGGPGGGGHGLVETVAEGGAPKALRPTDGVHRLVEVGAEGDVFKPVGEAGGVHAHGGVGMGGG